MASQLLDIRYYLSVQKGKADFALIAQGRKVMRNPKITDVPQVKKVQKALISTLQRAAHTGTRTSLPGLSRGDWSRSLTTPVLPSSVESVCPSRVDEFRRASTFSLAYIYESVFSVCVQLVFQFVSRESRMLSARRL